MFHDMHVDCRLFQDWHLIVYDDYKHATCLCDVSMQQHTKISKWIKVRLAGIITVGRCTDYQY